MGLDYPQAFYVVVLALLLCHPQSIKQVLVKLSDLATRILAKGIEIMEVFRTRGDNSELQEQLSYFS